MSGPDVATVNPASSITDRESAILASLRQDAAHFHGLSTREVERRRAEIFASLGSSELPAAVLPVIKEELRTSLSPIVLAGVARAVRRSRFLGTELIELLRTSAERISRHDEYVAFSDDKPVSPLTATQELAVTADTLSKEKTGSCSVSGPPPESDSQKAGTRLPRALTQTVVLENQSGMRCVMDDLLRGHRTLLAFFYTRCMNPAKCSLTVTRLASVARDLEQSDDVSGLLVLACTYDPDFDHDLRLQAYGRDRGFPFRENSMMVRCVDGWDLLRGVLDLKVGYSAATVNDHARELFLVGPELDVEPLSPDSIARPLVLAIQARGAENLDVTAVAGSCCCW
jgi:protein SCO1/2